MKLINTTNLSLRQQRNLLVEMIRTDFKLRYKGSALGYLWSLLKPLFLFAILYTVFTQFLRIGSGVPNYALSLLLGLVLWGFFTESTGGSLKSVISKGNLMRKIDIPRYLIPIPTIASGLINMFLSLTIVFIFLLFANDVAFSWHSIILFPLILLELLLLCTGVSYFLAALYVKFRDISYIWDVIKQALWYSIPLIYPITLIPSVAIQKIIILNPPAQIIQDARAVVTWDGTPTVTSLYGSWYFHLIPISIVIFVFVFGIYYYNRRSHSFAELI